MENNFISFLSNLVKYPIPSDGHCFFHCLLTAISEEYRQKDYKKKKLLAIELRKNLSLYLDKKLSDNKTVYQSLSRGNLPELSNYIHELKLDYLKKLLLSDNSVGESIFELVSEYLDIDLYVITKDINKKFILINNDRDLYHKKRPSIFIFYKHNHYELGVSPYISFDNKLHYQYYGFNVNKFKEFINYDY